MGRHAKHLVGRLAIPTVRQQTLCSPPRGGAPGMSRHTRNIRARRCIMPSIPRCELASPTHTAQQRTAQARLSASGLAALRRCALGCERGPWQSSTLVHHYVPGRRHRCITMLCRRHYIKQPMNTGLWFLKIHWLQFGSNVSAATRRLWSRPCL